MELNVLVRGTKILIVVVEEGEYTFCLSNTGEDNIFFPWS